MLEALTIALVASYFMLVWFRTNAFVEYLTLLQCYKFFHIGEYENIKNEGYGGSYVDFLLEYYNSHFIVRLLGCPVCLSFWLGVGLSFFVNLATAWVAVPLMLFFYLLFNKLL